MIVISCKREIKKKKREGESSTAKFNVLLPIILTGDQV